MPADPPLAEFEISVMTDAGTRDLQVRADDLAGAVRQLLGRDASVVAVKPADPEFRLRRAVMAGGPAAPARQPADPPPAEFEIEVMTATNPASVFACAAHLAHTARVLWRHAAVVAVKPADPSVHGCKGHMEAWPEAGG